MKITQKSCFALFLTIIYIFSCVPVFSANEPSNAILTEGFESDASFELWQGATRDAGGAYEGEWGIHVANPYGDGTTGVFGHILEYGDYLTLEEGKFYTFSAFVVNPAADSESEGEASAYIGRQGSELFIDISSVGYEWSMVTASFMATETVNVPLVITLSGGDEDIGFFMDNITVAPETRVPEYTVLEGPDSVFIPETGVAHYRYNLVTYDKDDIPINILIHNPQFVLEPECEGVEFFPDEGILCVSSQAENNQSFTLTCTSTVLGIKEVSKQITTTKNILTNTADELLWECNGDMDYSDGTLSLFADERGDFGYYTSITYSKQLLLIEGNMYVFRADVKSDDDFRSSSVYISNLSFAQSGYAEINITGIGGEESNVTSAFLIENTGLYDLTLNFYANTPRPIYVENIYLGIEEEAPASISIHAPGHIQTPSEMTALPCYALVRNQLGDIMDMHECDIAISPEGDGVYLEDGNIIVMHDAKPRDYEITATFEDIQTTHTITVSDNAIGDGGFEEKEPNEWWTSSEGSFFSIIDYDADKSGYVYSPDPSCIIINNSYMEILEGEYYVYTAAESFGSGQVTAFIADAETGEYIPFAQYDPTQEVRVPFSLDRTVLGRLVLYIESDTSVGLIIDDISIVPADLTVSEVSVTGGDYGDFIRGSYVYLNNMTDAADADISTTRWYISSSIDGHYAPIGIPNQDYLEFTPDMAGQYIVYEVTPICAYSGLVGESVRSIPLEIASADTSDKDTPNAVTQMAPVELESIKEHPFTDITAHWAEGIIASLTNAGIVSGRTPTKFVPDYYVTRAEFTAMVARAFSLVPVAYSGKFEDVSPSSWYAGWIEAAYTRGIIQGMDEKTFAPDERITREQMASIITRAYLMADGPLPYELEMSYYDTFLISPWAYDSVKLATNLNLFTGDNMNLFRPTDYATRAEAAAVIYRTLKSF